MLLHVADSGGRFYLLQFMDAWTEIFADPGKRTTGTGEAWFAVVRPGWTGRLPANVIRLDAPANQVWLLARTQTNGASDYDNVHTFQRGMRLVPLSEFPGTPRTTGTIQPSFSGSTRYRMHFGARNLPPVLAFWSVTAYDKDGYFIANPIDRYAMGDRDPLNFNPDGSLDLYIQNEDPGPDRQPNWLPSGNGPFNLTFRLYWPKPPGRIVRVSDVVGNPGQRERGSGMTPDAVFSGPGD